MARRAWIGRTVLRPLLVVVVLAWSSVVSMAADGDLDPTFGRKGTVVTDITPWNDRAADVAIQADGRIVVVGRASTRGGYGRLAVARYRSDGRLDRSFGGDGIVITNLSPREDAASAVAIQPGGRIVVVGTTTIAHRETVVVVRYRRRGALDRSFGDAGSVTVDLAPGSGHEVANDVAIQPDGRIVVVGSASASAAFVVARLDRLGSLDDTFHGDGIAITSFDAWAAVASAVALQPDGKVVVTGQSWTETGFDGIHVVRYLPDGELDDAFGAHGVASMEFSVGIEGGGDSAGGVALQPDGRIVVAGDAGGSAEYTSRFGIARLLPDGSLDGSLGGDGVVTTNFTKQDDSASDLVVQPDGKIVAVGVAGFGWGSLATFALVRYRVDGSLDPTFGGDGKVRTRVGGPIPIPETDIVGSWANAVTLQPDGRIVVVGDVDRLAGDRIDGRLGVARYRAG